MIATHEMGHALVAMALPDTDTVHKVSIIPRGIGALGYTIARPTEDRFLMTRQELEHKLMVLLGGRAAEHLVFGQWSTGAADDLAKVTDIARDMAMRYGMVDILGHVAYEPPAPRFLDLPHLGAGFNGHRMGPATQQRVDAAVQSLVSQAFERTVALLKSRRDLLERGAQQLLSQETLDEADLKALVATTPLMTPTASPA